MNSKLSQLSLMAGGSHYPSINPDMQEAFARLIINECIQAVANTNTHHARTTYDKSMVECTIEKSIAGIRETFGV
jgi:hypothetical protein